MLLNERIAFKYSMISPVNNLRLSDGTILCKILNGSTIGNDFMVWLQRKLEQLMFIMEVKSEIKRRI